MIQTPASNDHKIEVVVTAIDGDSLVLETVTNKKRIHWPIKNIPQPLDIGNRLTLELHQNDSLAFNAESAVSAGTAIRDTRSTATTAPSTDDNERKRRMLEELVN
jgi:hypothetical protein